MSSYCDPLLQKRVPQSRAQAEQPGLDRVFRQAEQARQAPDRVAVIIPAEKQLPVLARLRLQEQLNRQRDGLCVQLCLGPFAARQTVGKFGKQQLRLPAAALLRAGRLPARKGQIARDTAQKRPQTAGPRGRNGVPGMQIGVADAFLRVLMAVQNVEGNGGQ